MRQYELNSKAMSYSPCSVQLYVEPDNNYQYAICLKFFPCTSKTFLNFTLSSTWLLIKWFLMKITCTAIIKNRQTSRKLVMMQGSSV